MRIGNTVGLFFFLPLLRKGEGANYRLTLSGRWVICGGEGEGEVEGKAAIVSYIAHPYIMPTCSDSISAGEPVNGEARVG